MMNTPRSIVVIGLCVWLAVTSVAAPWDGRTRFTRTVEAASGDIRFEAEPIRTTGGAYRYRLIATRSTGGETAFRLVLETFGRPGRPAAAWHTVRDLASRDRLPVLETETTASGTQVTTIGLSAEYLERRLSSRERARWVLEAEDARDELEIPKAYVYGLLRAVRKNEPR